MTEFVTWQGRTWESHFGDPVAEHRAVRSDVGVWDVSPLRKWNFHGCGVLAALDRIFTNDIRDLQPGQARYSAFCDATGHLLGDAVLFLIEIDRAWVFTARDADGAHFRRVLGSAQVGVEEFTDEMACLQLQGPRSRELLHELSGRPGPGTLRRFRFGRAPVRVAGVPCLVARLGYSGEPGYELFCAMTHRTRLWDELVAAGARPYGFAAVNTLRIEAGLIMLDQDYIPGVTNPYDISLGRVIKLHKGPFHGRDGLRRLSRDRTLATLVWQGKYVPWPQSPVLAHGKLIGVTTSACSSPTFHLGLGLSILETAAATPGDLLQIHDGDVVINAHVSKTPAYAPARRRLGA